ncbi:hypothetical protein N0V88_006803 [Collariella sp. IMI 366227]|nr:hypothetical protein N0V88_006803 [Collariella sp. IMI 366227]
MYTASFAFFEALWEAGVTHVFVNLGSDHPSIIEAMVKGAREKEGQFPRMITCPNEGLGAAVHNSSTGRAPVFVFAGISPITQDGELRGSRTEFIHWVQDVPDQKQIVAQYCRYAGEIKTGVNVKQMVNRALQFAVSQPQGPVYLCGSREVMEMEIGEYKVRQGEWEAVELGVGWERGEEGCGGVGGGEEPLVVTGYGVEDAIRTADVILVLDCDVPWIATQCKPREDAKIFHIDVDPLKQMMPVHWIQAQHRYRADALTSIEQITALLKSNEGLKALLAGEEREKRWTTLQESHKKRLEGIAARLKPLDNGEFGTSYLCGKLRDMCPQDTIWAVEAVTNTVFVHDAIQPTLPGQWFNCGGGGLGWSGGGALGIDGTFLFSVPSSVYWISKRYNLPVLTIVLNNKGWNAPRRSLLLVHPEGLGSQATNEEINIAIDGPIPDFGGIAKAAAGGDLYTARVDQAADLEKVLKEAIEVVKGGQTAVVDCKVAFC